MAAADGSTEQSRMTTAMEAGGAAGESDVTQAADSFVGLPISRGVREGILVLSWLSCVSGVLGNVLIIVTLLTQPALRSLHNMYIGNLALADLAVEAYCLPFWLLDLMLGRHPVLGPHHCVLNAFLQTMFMQTSLYTLVAIGFNRYLSVCRSGLYRRLFGKTGTVVSCLLIWGVSSAVGLLPVFRVDGSAYAYRNLSHTCSFDGITKPWNAFIMIEMASIVVSTLLVGAFSLAIFRHYQRSRNKVTQRLPSGRRAADTQMSQADMALVRSLLLVFLLLLVLCLPIAMVMAVVGKVPVSADLLCCLNFLFFLNNSINWIVYGALNSNFRKGYRKLLTGGCRG